ncbi:MAG TPA: hypothetical protein VGT41_04625 [Candidatus Babeliales bacterium]|nr:hypothetical protein [Candidatus Babeliales bacterium]
MTNKTNTRVTIDIPTVDHKKLKMLAAFYGKSMREVVVELLERGLEHYSECPESHIPNEITKQALDDLKTKKGLKKAVTVEELFKKLS